MHRDAELSHGIHLPGINSITADHQLPEIENVEHAVSDGIGAGGEEESFVFPMIARSASSPGGHGGDHAGIVVGDNFRMAAAEDLAEGIDDHRADGGFTGG